MLSTIYASRGAIEPHEKRERNCSRSLFFILYSIGLRSPRQLLGLNNHLTILHNQSGYLPRCNHTCHEGIRQGIIDMGLDSAAQWSCTILLIEALAQQQVFYLVADDQFDLLLDESTSYLCQEQVNNP